MRILAIPDKKGWAMEHHCQDLREALHKECQIDIKYFTRDPESLEELKRTARRGYDCIYPTWKIPSITVYEAIDENLKPKVLCGLHSFHMWDKGACVGSKRVKAVDVNPQLVDKLAKFTLTVAICEGLQEAFDTIKPRLAHHGINTKIFHPLKNKQVEERILTVGWVGTFLNIKHNYPLFDRIKSLMKGQIEFREVIAKNADSRILSRKEMNAYYNTLDILVVTSLSEGSPLPPLEAAACGVPTISPMVGAMPEFIRDGIDGFLIDTYDPQSFIEKITFLSDNKNVLKGMRQACLEKAATSWSLAHKGQDWLRCFRAIKENASK